MKRWILPLAPFLILGFAVFHYINNKTDIAAIRYANKREFKSLENSSLELENKIMDDFRTIDNPPSDQRVSFALDIRGSEKFKTKIKEALRILWLYDRDESFRMVRRYVFEIRQSNRTNFSLDNGTPVAEISEEMFENSSETYLASVIAHLGWHGYYLYLKKNRNKKEIPLPGDDKIDKTYAMPFGTDFKKLDDLYRVEEEAFKYQALVLGKINAPLGELRILKNRPYRDFSPAHDGNYFIQF